MQGGIPSPLPKSLRIYLRFNIKISSKHTFLTSRLFYFSADLLQSEIR